MPKFLTHMDKEARRALWVVIAMFVVVVAMILFGKNMVTADEATYQRFFETMRGSPWALPLVIATFVCAAFLGVPQWALIAGTVVAFGPLAGSVYAWGAAMVSASVNFWLGRYVGAQRVRKFGGEQVNRIVGVIRRNGFVSSLAVRLVPTGPFVLVNMAAGVSGMRFWVFSAGTGIGIIPKILIVGLLAQGMLSGAQGDKIMLVFLVLALIFVVVMLLARKALRRQVSLDE